MQRREDIRTWKLMCTQYKEPPDAGVIFPLLKDDSESEEPSDDEDDFLKFHEVTESLTTKE